MRHRKGGRKLGMDSSARKAMFRNMVTSLMVHGQIRTTVARAKELRRHAERLITISKRAPSLADLEGLEGDDLARAKAHRVAAIRRIRQVVMDGDVVQRIMGDYADRFRTRPGGYTRVVKLSRPRPGDNARMAVIQLVNEAYDPKAEKGEAMKPAVESAPAEEISEEAVSTEAADAEAVEVEAADDTPTDVMDDASPAAEGEAELVDDEDAPKE
ncbi:MAG: bL17 family ribosomal protein [Myxococcota bacterium]